MNKHAVLDTLDYPKAALRTLFVLHTHYKGLNVMALFRVMSERFGVGRPATESSYKALLDAGLAEMVDMKINGRSFKVIKITDVGNKIAIKLRQIVSVLDSVRLSGE